MYNGRESEGREGTRKERKVETEKEVREKSEKDGMEEKETQGFYYHKKKLSIQWLALSLAAAVWPWPCSMAALNLFPSLRCGREQGKRQHLCNNWGSWSVHRGCHGQGLVFPFASVQGSSLSLSVSLSHTHTPQRQREMPCQWGAWPQGATPACCQLISRRPREHQIRHA